MLARRGLFRLAFWSAAAAAVTRPVRSVAQVVARKLRFVTVSKDGPVTSIQQALAMCESGGTIYVKAGHYEVHEPLDFTGKTGMTIMGDPGARATFTREQS